MALIGVLIKRIDDASLPCDDEVDTISILGQVFPIVLVLLQLVLYLLVPCLADVADSFLLLAPSPPVLVISTKHFLILLSLEILFGLVVLGADYCRATALTICVITDCIFAC